MHQRRLLDDLATCSVQHLLFSHLCLVVAKHSTCLSQLLLVFDDIVGRSRGARARNGILCGSDRNVDDNGGVDGVFTKIVLGCLRTVCPLARGCVRAQDEKCQCHDDDDDTRDDECHSPGDVGGQTIGYQAVVDGGHEEVSDASTSVTKTSSQSIGSADNVLVVETSRPYLARHKAAAQDADEEATSVQLVDVVYCAREEGGNGANQKTSCKCVSWPESVTRRTSDQADQKCCTQSDDVGVGHLDLGDFEVFLDDIVEQRWKGVPVWDVSSSSVATWCAQSVITHQDQKANRKPNQEKKKTRPYLFTGFKTGTDRAFLVMGLTSGLLQRRERRKPMSATVAPS